jgi:hypothetical protein
MSAQLAHEVTQTRTAEQAAAAGRRGLRGAWRRIRLTVQEMNYATRRITELQTSWIVDESWHSR